MECTEYTLIEKEEVSSLAFPADEVLRKEREIVERNEQMKKAIALGNLEHQKVKIYFEDAQGCKCVHTTIWAVTDKAIVLKQNSVIPIHRIVKLEI